MLHIPAVLTGEALARVRAHLAEGAWIDGRDTAGHASVRVKHNRQLDERDAAAAAAGAIVLAALEANPHFVSAALPARIVPPLFNRYAPGDHYGPHIDGAIRPLAPAMRLRTDLSATLFLSEEDDYAGGALCIRDGSGEHRVRLPAGDLILYSAGSVHHVEPVERGVRVAAFFWIQSLVRDGTRREMLHALDEAIQQVAGELPDSPALVSLHGHYHNLLRQWADP